MNKPFLMLAASAALLTAAAGTAFAGPVDTAKAQCIVTEQADGYLAIIDAGRADGNLRREVRAINQQRKAAYADVARRNGVTTDAAARSAGERLVARSGGCR